MDSPVVNIPNEATAWLIGRFEKSLDDKNRLVIPSSFRKVLRSDELILTRWFDGALALFPAGVWQPTARAIGHMPLYSPSERSMRLSFFSSAHPQSMDGQGRIVLGEDMKEYADIDSDTVLLGDWDKIQIWSPRRYKEFRKKNDVTLDDELEDALARVAAGQRPETEVTQPSQAAPATPSAESQDSQTPAETDAT